MKKLIEIQKKLKAPKGQTNSFGGYKYRSCEDILEAVKPLCAEKGVLLNLSDEIVQVGDRYYVHAKATFLDTGDDGKIISVSAYAREAENKKGMDESQITGAASSYARKYALNGLFLIDDNKDADTQDNTYKQEPIAAEVFNEKYQELDKEISDAKNLDSLLEAGEHIKNASMTKHYRDKLAISYKKKKGKLEEGELNG